MSKGVGSKGAVISGDYQQFWSTVPEKALHPIRVPILEALRRIGEPLSAIGLVDVLDGFLTMWEAAHHLQALETLGVVEPATVGQPDTRKKSGFEVAYRLKTAACGDD